MPSFFVALICMIWKSINNVKAIARAGAGVNNIPVNDLTERGIVVFNTPGANANAVKEIVLTTLMASSRNLFDGVIMD